MTSSQNQDRISRLEQRLWRYQFALAGLLLSFACFVLIGQDELPAVPPDNPPELHESEGFVIRNANGDKIQVGQIKDMRGKDRFGVFLSDSKNIPRALLYLDENAQSFFELTDSKGRKRLHASVLPGGESEIAMFDDDTKPRLALLSYAEASSIKIMRPNDGPEVTIAASDSGATGVQVHGGKSRPMAMMGYAKGKTSTGFHIIDRESQVLRASFGFDNGVSALRLWDTDKKEGVTLNVTADGAAVFALRKNGTAAGVAADITSGGDAKFQVTDRDGKAILKAP